MINGLTNGKNTEGDEKKNFSHLFSASLQKYFLHYFAVNSRKLPGQNWNLFDPADPPSYPE